jgi:hypothetical protein
VSYNVDYIVIGIKSSANGENAEALPEPEPGAVEENTLQLLEEIFCFVSPILIFLHCVHMASGCSAFRRCSLSPRSSLNFKPSSGV